MGPIVPNSDLSLLLNTATRHTCTQTPLKESIQGFSITIEFAAPHQRYHFPVSNCNGSSERTQTLKDACQLPGPSKTVPAEPLGLGQAYHGRFWNSLSFLEVARGEKWGGTGGLQACSQPRVLSQCPLEQARALSLPSAHRDPKWSLRSKARLPPHPPTRWSPHSLGKGGQGLLTPMGVGAPGLDIGLRAWRWASDTWGAASESSKAAARMHMTQTESPELTSGPGRASSVSLLELMSAGGGGGRPGPRGASRAREEASQSPVAISNMNFPNLYSQHPKRRGETEWGAGLGWGHAGSRPRVSLAAKSLLLCP